MQDKQQQKDGINASEAFHLMYFLANVHATCISPFIRSGFGAEHPGFCGFFSMIFILLVACNDPTCATHVYFFAWACALGYRRVQSNKLLWQGVQLHSRCAGYPWLAMRIPFVRTEATALRVVEPMLCLIAGLLLVPVSETVGAMVMGGFMSFAIRNGIETEITRKRLQAMRDARIEQEYYSQRFRQPLKG